MIIALFYISVIFVFLGKAIADIVSDEPHWKKSIFNKYPIDSFYGCKDDTWVRKHNYKNKYIKYLFQTIFVFTTDIWHFANFIHILGVYLSVIFSVICGYYYGFIFIYNIFGYIFLNLIGFHICYHYILKRKKLEE